MPTDLNVTVGALLLGVLITAVGFGITTMQTYLYFTRFPKDPWWTRATVWSLLFLDTAHVTLSWHMIYYYLILNFDNRPALDDSVWSFDITIVLTAIITVIVHCFYARRVFIMGGRNWFLVTFILSLSVLRLVFGCIVTAKIFVLKNLALLPQKISALVGTGLGAGTLADCIITVALVYILRGHKAGFNQLDNVLDKITYWTVNNGALTSIVGIIVIVTFSAMPDNMIFLSVHLLLSKLYANSLLATLNFRQSHRGRGMDTDDVSIPLRSGPRHTSALNFSDGKESQVVSARPGPVVHIVTSTTSDAVYPSKAKNAGAFRPPDYPFEADAAGPLEDSESDTIAQAA